MSDFWVTNISEKNVSLSDLALTIPAKKSYNLLDSKRFRYTEDQLINSVMSGSLYKKRDKIRLSSGPMQMPEKRILEVSKVPMIRQVPSAAKMEDKVYEELIISDEKFADEFSEDLTWNPAKKK